METGKEWELSKIKVEIREERNTGKLTSENLVAKSFRESEVSPSREDKLQIAESEKRSGLRALKLNGRPVPPNSFQLLVSVPSLAKLPGPRSTP